MGYLKEFLKSLFRKKKFDQKKLAETNLNRALTLFNVTALGKLIIFYQKYFN